MKKVYVVRHAKSSWDNASLSDFDRPLNNRGMRDVPDMGQRLSRLQVLPDLLISSPANRAHTTAKGIAHEIGYDPLSIRTEPDLYHEGTQTIREVISKIDDSVESVMIFGHNPGFTDLIARLSDLNLYNLPTCAVCGIELDINSWKEIINTSGKKFYYDYPKSVSGSTQ